ncbi:MAG: type II toxin-antitoxin system ParD family antitoxin [Robiginitomaculum sp.]|nr:type II toxin-antitoxin system ParD family antitoxin [Robiginitomaculum sp.]
MAIVKTTLSLTDLDRRWMDGMIASGEYVSNSEYIRNLIRRDKESRTETPAEIAYIRAKLIKSEQSGFTDLGRDEILAKSKAELRKNGVL